MSGNCSCDGTITSLADVNAVNCNSAIAITSIPTSTDAQALAREVYNSYLVPTGQPATISPKAPLVFTKMLDTLLGKIAEEFLSTPKIIRVFDAFNYNNGQQMTMTQYDSIMQACTLYWRAKNFELFKQDTKLFFNFCIQDYISGKFYVSYKPNVYNCDKLIDDFNDPNYGANGYRQWLGNYVGTKKMTGQTGNYQNVYVDGYKFSSIRAMSEGQFFETRGFQLKSRALARTFSGSQGTDITFQFIMSEQDTTVQTTSTILSNGNTQSVTTERNALGQSKISTTVTDSANNILSMAVTYVDGISYNIISNIDY